jgi:hypothetical protein
MVPRPSKTRANRCWKGVARAQAFNNQHSVDTGRGDGGRGLRSPGKRFRIRWLGRLILPMHTEAWKVLAVCWFLSAECSWEAVPLW